MHVERSAGVETADQRSQVLMHIDLIIWFFVACAALWLDGVWQ